MNTDWGKGYGHFLSLMTGTLLGISLVVSGCGSGAGTASSGAAGESTEESIEETAKAENTAAADADSSGENGNSADDVSSGAAKTEGDFEEGTSSDAGGTGTDDAADEVDYASLIDTGKMPHIDAADYPRVDGSTATLPLSTVLYSLTTGSSMDEAEHTVYHTKTRNAYYGLVQDNGDGTYGTDLLLAYEPSEDIREDLDKSGVELTFKPIGRDALVFLINAGNPVRSLSEQQIVGIYSGKITKWSDVGGEKKPIDAFQRPQNSGSQTLMEKLVMRGTKLMAAPSYKMPTEMGDLIDSVSGYDNSSTAIGYSVYFYAHNMYAMPDLRLLAVNGVEPSNETIRDGDYPYVNDFYAVIRKNEPSDSPAHQLFDWLTEDGGQQLLNVLGYVSVNNVDSASGNGTDSASASGRELAQEGFRDWMIQRSGKSYSLGKNVRILANMADLEEAPALVLMDGSLSEEDRIPNVGFSVMGGPFQVADVTEPIALVDTTTGKEGLYDLTARKWLLQPEYDSVNKVSGEDGVYEAVKYADWNEENQSYDGEDQLIRWKDGKISEKTSSNEEESDITTDDNGDAVLKDQKGKVIFSRDSLGKQAAEIVGKGNDPADFQLSIYDASKEGIVYGGLSVSDPAYQSFDFLYRLSDEKLLTKGGAAISTVYPDDGSGMIMCYAVQNDAGENDGAKDKSKGTESLESLERYVLDANGNVLKAQDGTAFTYSLQGGLFAYQKPNGDFVLESQDGGEHYELKSSDVADLDTEYDPIGNRIAKGIYTLGMMKDDLYRSDIFQGNSLLYGGEKDTTASAWDAGNGYAVVSDQNRESIYEVSSGKKLMDLPEQEYFMLADRGVFITSGGGFYYFRDGNGDEVGRISSQLEGDD